ncbi:hypothetical protein ACFSSA_11645 [Luteolibacter algae]|uniref:Uncharacterized protein n=1 Tax=Luteolibacter algae TaxID=454151 RepID=A0ABW5D9T7_9BACT
MSRSWKKFLSILFHLIVLAGMVMVYDSLIDFAKNMGWVSSKPASSEKAEDEKRSTY